MADQTLNRHENFNKTGIDMSSKAGRHIQWKWDNMSTSYSTYRKYMSTLRYTLTL